MVPALAHVFLGKGIGGHHRNDVPKRANSGDIIPMVSPSVRILETVDLSLETVQRARYSFKTLLLMTIVPGIQTV